MLFARKVTDGGVTFTKKQRKTMSSRFYVCDGSDQHFFESEARRTREHHTAADALREVRLARRRSLVSNLVASSSPVEAAAASLHAVESFASALAPPDVAATLGEDRCADSGLSAVASAYAGALSAVLGGPSGVTSDAAPGAALAFFQRQSGDGRNENG